jgi:hypothetical protein
MLKNEEKNLELIKNLSNLLLVEQLNKYVSETKTEKRITKEIITEKKVEEPKILEKKGIFEKEIVIDEKLDEEEIIKFEKKIKSSLSLLLNYSIDKDKSITQKWIQYFIKPDLNTSISLYKPTNFIYQGTNVSGTFVPLLQTFYKSDAKEISENMKTTPLAVTYKDMKEKVRASYMNINGDFNYFDPEIEERFKIWKLFSFNFMLTALNYQYFST